MADVERNEKPTVESVDNVGPKNLSGSHHGHNVGYEEYREALHLEISDREVSILAFNMGYIGQVDANSSSVYR